MTQEQLEGTQPKGSTVTPATGSEPTVSVPGEEPAAGTSVLDADERQPARNARSDAAPGLTPEPPTRPRHFPCFDGLRAIAAISILLLHTAWVSGFTLRSPLGPYTSRLEIGVPVFFLISGFLLYRPFVSSHLAPRRDPNVFKFWVRRLLRIVPAYWLALTVLTYGFHAVKMGPGWQGIAVHYLFLQIYIPKYSLNGITQAWSLCTEMSFYLFLPLYAMVIGFRRSSSMTQRLVRELIGLVVLVAISLVFRWWALNLPFFKVVAGSGGRPAHFVALCAPHCATEPILSSLMIDWLPALLDLFALGMFLATLSAWFSERDSEPHWLRNPSMPWLSWACAAVVFVWVSHIGIPRDILYLVTPTKNIYRQSLYGLFAFFMLLPAVFGPSDQTLVRKFLRLWPVASLGVISYGIYIWHLDLITVFTRWTGMKYGASPYWILALAVFSLTVVFATASYFGLEKPILTLKDRIGWWDRSNRPGRSDPPPRPSAVEADQMIPLAHGSANPT